ncbi:GLE1-like protein-domain-containing protein [Gautieria morchelliformis]|nr:GLE1-like protein-domain-containing protein [Gautieria morchelliformis]
MRFGVAPSRSPSPERHQTKPRNPNRLKRSPHEQREIDETLLSFRRRGEYEDPFKQWAKDTRTAAFRAASKRFEANPASVAATRRRETELSNLRVKESYNRQYEEVTTILEQMNIRRKQEEARLVTDYKERERLMWQRVDEAIKGEEEKVRRRLEAEEKARREEEERVKREEERVKLEEERKKAEEEQRKRDEQERILREELLRKKKEKEAEDAKKQADAEAQQRAEMARLDQERKNAGDTTPQEDWEIGRQSLKLLKEGYVPAVKADANLRTVWSRGRRAIVPKIGQLTNSQSEIDRITTAILQIVLVQPPYPEPLYFSLLSALAKSILMQAETEVSARAVTAIPLAKVTIGLLLHIQFFSDVLYARMVQRTGGWVIPIPVGKPANMSEAGYKKLRGYRTEREEQKEFETRVEGIMTLYFAILTTDVPQPLPPLWSLPRLWTYITRLTSTPILLRSDMAMQIITAFLVVGGVRARQVWGDQFVRLLEMLYKGIQQTSDARSDSREPDPKQVGASGPEGRSGRVRVVLEIEKVMAN